MEVSEIGAFNSRVMWTNVQLLKPFPGFSLQPIPGWSNQTPHGQPIPFPGPATVPG